MEEWAVVRAKNKRGKLSTVKEESEDEMPQTIDSIDDDEDEDEDIEDENEDEDIEDDEDNIIFKAYPKLLEKYPEENMKIMADANPKNKKLQQIKGGKKAWKNFHKTKHMSAHHFEAAWEETHAELEEVGLPVSEQDKFLGYLEKIGPQAKFIRMDRRDRIDRSAPLDSNTAGAVPRMVNLLPETWEECQAVLVERETLEAGIQSFLQGALGALTRRAGLTRGSRWAEVKARTKAKAAVRLPEVLAIVVEILANVSGARIALTTIRQKPLAEVGRAAPLRRGLQNAKRKE